MTRICLTMIVMVVFIPGCRLWVGDGEPDDPNLLDPAERKWLEEYQAGCLERLRSHLPEGQTAELQAWLTQG